MHGSHVPLSHREHAYVDRGVHTEHAPWYIISWFRPHAKSGSSKHVSGIPGYNPVFRYNPGISRMFGRYASHVDLHTIGRGTIV